MSLNTLLRAIWLWFAVALVGIVAGCSTRMAEMVPDTYDLGARHLYSVNISVVSIGGSGDDESPLRSRAAFAEAIGLSIEKSGVFREWRRSGPADYLIEVRVTEVEVPGAGLNMTVWFRAMWTLVRTADGRSIWTETIVGRHTATVGDAFAGMARARLAAEGAARDHIRKAIEAMSRATLRPASAPASGVAGSADSAEHIGIVASPVGRAPGKRAGQVIEVAARHLAATPTPGTAFLLCTSTELFCSRSSSRCETPT